MGASLSAVSSVSTTFEFSWEKDDHNEASIPGAAVATKAESRTSFLLETLKDLMEKVYFREMWERLMKSESSTYGRSIITSPSSHHHRNPNSTVEKKKDGRRKSSMLRTHK